MTIQIIQTILLLTLLALVLYANKVVDQRMKQIKTDYYLKGFKEGCKLTSEKTIEIIRGSNNKLSVDKSEESQ